MSRIGKKMILIPTDVEVKITDQKILIKGPQGSLEQALPDFVKIEIKENELKVLVDNPNNKEQRACWGTIAALIRNMIKGVKDGFEKTLELVGVGYRAELKGDKLILNLGFSHPIEFDLSPKVEAKIEKNSIILKSIDKQLLGETAAQIRRFRKPEPYKGKGIKYAGEIIRRKAGKKVSAGGSS
jgi:large subunit ribosomal protein L6